MRTAPPARSPFHEAFRCIGSDCEDTCCQGWNVPIDQITYQKYRALPASPLATMIRESIAENPKSAAPAVVAGDDKPVFNAGSFGRILIDGKNHCPLLTADRLCRIHAELGPQMLSYACSTYPRIVHQFLGHNETALALSCPAAARLVLLDSDLLDRGLHAPPFGDAPEGTNPLPPDFLEIRQSVLWLLKLRSYPLWQRMFLLGLLCRRLDSIARGELNRSVQGFLADFKTAVQTGALRPAMETLPVDRTAQLDVVLRLAGLMLHRSNVSPRFSESVQAFTSGIGNGPGATLESLTVHYAQAHDLSFEPFFRRHPHILENYLVNTIIRCQFPFGCDGMNVGAEPDRAQEFARLTAQFALVRGLLIGVAGFHGAAFSTAHVVKTVQSAAKHFEHHPKFLKLAYELLTESQMDGARGMAILLRNAGQETPAAVSSSAFQSRSNLAAPGIEPIERDAL